MTVKSGREAPISYRPPAALRDEFLARVERSGLSASGYITHCIFKHNPPRQVRRPPVERQEVARLLAETARLQDSLLAIAAASDADAELLAEACRDLQEIRAACLSALGRKP